MAKNTYFALNHGVLELKTPGKSPGIQLERGVRGATMLLKFNTAVMGGGRWVFTINIHYI